MKSSGPDPRQASAVRLSFVLGMLGRPRLVLRGDSGNFDLCPADQTRNLYGSSRRFGVWHKLFIDIVHLGHILQVRDINGHGCDVRHLKARFLDYFFDCGNRICSLFGDTGPREFTGRVGPLLACNPEDVARHISIAKWHAFLEVDGGVLGKCTGQGAKHQHAHQPQRPLECKVIPLFRV